MYRLATLLALTRCYTYPSAWGAVWDVLLGILVALVAFGFVFGIAFVSSWIDDVWKRRKRRR